MDSPILFLVVALRAVLELIFWVLIGRAALAMLAGRAATNNAVLRMFDAFLMPPRALVARVLPGGSARSRDLLLVVMLLVLWLALAVCKRWLLP